jgi:hypothetical protein
MALADAIKEIERLLIILANARNQAHHIIEINRPTSMLSSPSLSNMRVSKEVARSILKELDDE